MRRSQVWADSLEAEASVLLVWISQHVDSAYSVRSTTYVVMNLNKYPSGVLDFCDIAEVCGSARLSQIRPPFCLVVETLSFVPESDCAKLGTEEAKSQVARVVEKFANVSTKSSGTSDFGIEILFLDR